MPAITCSHAHVMTMLTCILYFNICLLIHVSTIVMFITLTYHATHIQALNPHQLSLSSGLDYHPNAGMEQDPGEAGPSQYQSMMCLEQTISCLVLPCYACDIHSTSRSLWYVLFSWVRPSTLRDL